MCGFWWSLEKAIHISIRQNLKNPLNCLLIEIRSNKSLYLKNLSLEFFRLSIRDLSSNGNQPMWIK